MKFYTSYFGNLWKLKQVGIVPICIARGIPKFYGGLSIQSVAPYSWMLKDDVTREQYIDAYLHKVLPNVDPVEFIKEVEKLSDGKDVAFLCYEKPSDFCHRHLFADWLEDQTGVEVKEFNVVGRPWEHKNPETIQGSLFDD